jgi:hypothetical protein
MTSINAKMSPVNNRMFSITEQSRPTGRNEHSFRFPSPIMTTKKQTIMTTNKQKIDQHEIENRTPADLDKKIKGDCCKRCWLVGGIALAAFVYGVYQNK